MTSKIQHAKYFYLKKADRMHLQIIYFASKMYLTRDSCWEVAYQQQVQALLMWATKRCPLLKLMEEISSAKMTVIRHSFLMIALCPLKIHLIE